MYEQRTYFEPELGGRITFQRLTCDECERTYPADGNFGDGAAFEAEMEIGALHYATEGCELFGWDIIDGRELCVDCQFDRAIRLALA